ncbi:site-specific integrase [Corynebacterium sp.]|uniref:tyrosine-type recombinase/integrase n=1 Tax=Corynebacterium sp. TaxID=1720 RepID=UPI0028AB5C0F|nr:site-specific integrase [Corynebacterium sp.]
MTVRDQWHKTITETDPASGEKTKRKVRSSRYGVGSRWLVQYTDLEGGRAARSFATREEADFFDSSVKVNRSDGTLIAASKRDVRLADLWQPWLDTKAHVAEKTRKDYVSYWSVHIQPVWGNKRVSEIQEHQVVAWIAGLTTMKSVPMGGEPRPMSGSAKKKIADILGSMLTRAVKLKIIPANPLDGSSKPRVGKSERRYLNIEEVDGLLFAAKNDAVKLMLEVLLKTGLRVGEAKGLKVKDLDTERRRLYIRRDVDDLGKIDETKTRQHRDVPLSQMMALLLEEHAEDRDPESFLLPDEYGKVWTTARWRAIWANLLADAGIESTLKTHELRHTAVSMAIAGGADVYVVQRMCGHATATTTLNAYGHLWDHGLDEAAEAIERHLVAERKRVESLQARRAQREKDSGVRHLRVVE